MAAWRLNSSIAGQVASTLISPQAHKCSEGNLFRCVQCFLVVVANTTVGLLIKSDFSFTSDVSKLLRTDDMYILSPPNVVAFFLFDFITN